MSAFGALSFPQNADEPGSKDHPLAPRLPGYHIADYETSDFDEADFPLASDKIQTVDGRHWNVRYAVDENQRRSNPPDILLNYQNLFSSKGGVVLFKDVDETTLRLKTPTGELWCHVDVAYDGDVYTVDIIEKSDMAQQSSPIAADIARALNQTGSIALHNILFDAGKAKIRSGSSAALAAIADVLKSDAALRLEIQGHTDNVGAKAANQALSLARASAVRDYLIKRFGIAPDRLTATGMGDTKPIADNRTEKGRAQNRRVELVKLGTRGESQRPGAGPASGPGEWTGRITAGMMAIGGETTGIVLATDQAQLELQPADDAMRQRLQQLNGRTVTIRGTLETREGVEVRTRRIIRVTEIVER